MSDGLNEKRCAQTLIRLPAPLEISHLLQTFFEPVQRNWRFTAEDIQTWISPAGPKRKRLNSIKMDRSQSVIGEFLHEDKFIQLFRLSIIKTLRKGLYATANYLGKRTDNEFSLHLTTTLESAGGIEEEDFCTDDMTAPLRNMVAKYAFQDSHFPVTNRPHPGAERRDVSRIIESIFDQKRILPVIVFSEPWDKVNINSVATRLAGIAHVASLTKHLNHKLTEAIGKTSSVFNGYARIYVAPFIDTKSDMKNRNYTFSPTVLNSPDVEDIIVQRIYADTLHSKIIEPAITTQEIETINATLAAAETIARDALKNTPPPAKVLPSTVLHAPSKQRTEVTPECLLVRQTHQVLSPITKIISDTPLVSIKEPEVSNKAEKLPIGHKGAWIKWKRVQKGWSLSELASRIGYTGPGIMLLEQKANPKHPKLNEIFDVLELDPNEINNTAPPDILAATPEPKLPSKQISKHAAVSMSGIRQIRNTEHMEQESINELAKMISQESKNAQIQNGLASKILSNEKPTTVPDIFVSAESIIAEMRIALQAEMQQFRIEITENMAAIGERFISIEKTLRELHVTLALGPSGKPNVNNAQLAEVGTAVDLLNEVLEKLGVNATRLGNQPQAQETSQMLTPKAIIEKDPLSKKAEVAWSGTYPPTLKPEYVVKFLEAYKDSIVIHPRAIKALKETIYEKPERVYRALEILARDYGPMRRKGQDSGIKFDHVLESFNKIGLRLEKHQIDKSLGSSFEVKWEDRKYKINQILKSKSSPVDPRRCLRIYFFWDDQSKRIVLCWLPSHLEAQVKF